jgi:hypothetical protein
MNNDAKKEATFAAICGMESEVQRLKIVLASVDVQLPYY